MIGYGHPCEQSIMIVELCLSAYVRAVRDTNFDERSRSNENICFGFAYNCHSRFVGFIFDNSTFTHVHFQQQVTRIVPLHFNFIYANSYIS